MTLQATRPSMGQHAPPLFWSTRDRGFENVAILMPDRLFCARVLPQQAQWIREHVSAGGEPQNLMIEGAVDIPLDDVHSVSYQQHGRCLDIVYGQGQSHTVLCHTPAMRDGILAALRTPLGNAFAEDTARESVLSAAGQPLAWAAIVVIGTGLTYYAALGWEQPQNHGSRQSRWSGKAALLLWVAGMLGSTGIAIVGAIALIGVLFWMARRISRRPLIIRLQRA